MSQFPDQTALSFLTNNQSAVSSIENVMKGDEVTNGFAQLCLNLICQNCKLIVKNPKWCKSCKEQSLICNDCITDNIIQCKICFQDLDTEKADENIDDQLSCLENKTKKIVKVVYCRVNTHIVWNNIKNIKITNFRAYKEKKFAREFIIYKIEVDGNILERRYNDFQALHSHLIRQYKGHIIPLLPPKHSIENQIKQIIGQYGYTQQFLNQRRQQLEAYLILIYGNIVFKNDIVLQDFITQKVFEYPEEETYKTQMNMLLGAIVNINDTVDFGIAYIQNKWENPNLQYSDIIPFNIEKISKMASGIFKLNQILDQEQNYLNEICIQLESKYDNPKDISNKYCNDPFFNKYLDNFKEIRILNSMLLYRTEKLKKRIEGLQFATETIILHYEDITVKIKLRDKKRQQGLYEEDNFLTDQLDLLTKHLQNMSERLEKDSTQLIDITKFELSKIIRQYKYLKIWEQFIHVRPTNFLNIDKLVLDLDDREKKYYLKDSQINDYEYQSDEDFENLNNFQQISNEIQEAKFYNNNNNDFIVLDEKYKIEVEKDIIKVNQLNSDEEEQDNELLLSEMDSKHASLNKKQQSKQQKEQEINDSQNSLENSVKINQNYENKDEQKYENKNKFQNDEELQSENDSQDGDEEQKQIDKSPKNQSQNIYKSDISEKKQQQQDNSNSEYLQQSLKSQLQQSNISNNLKQDNNGLENLKQLQQRQQENEELESEDGDFNQDNNQEQNNLQKSEITQQINFKSQEILNNQQIQQQQQFENDYSENNSSNNTSKDDLSSKSQNNDQSFEENKQRIQKQIQNSELLKSQKNELQQSQNSELLKSQKSELQQSQKSELQQSQKSELQQSQKSQLQQSQKSQLQQSQKSELLHSQLSCKQQNQIQNSLIQNNNNEKQFNYLEQSQKSELQQSQKSKLQQSQKSELQQSQKNDLQQSQNSELQLSQKSELQQSQKSELQQSQKSEFQKSQKSELQQSQNSELQQSQKSELQQSQNSELQQSQNIALQQSQNSEQQQSKDSELNNSQKSQLENIQNSEIFHSQKSQLEKSQNSELHKSNKSKISQMSDKQLKPNDQQNEFKSSEDLNPEIIIYKSQEQIQVNIQENIQQQTQNNLISQNNNVVDDIFASTNSLQFQNENNFQNQQKLQPNSQQKIDNQDNEPDWGENDSSNSLQNSNQQIKNQEQDNKKSQIQQNVDQLFSPSCLNSQIKQSEDNLFLNNNQQIQQNKNKQQKQKLNISNPFLDEYNENNTNNIQDNTSISRIQGISTILKPSFTQAESIMITTQSQQQQNQSVSTDQILKELEQPKNKKESSFDIDEAFKEEENKEEEDIFRSFDSPQRDSLNNKKNQQLTVNQEQVNKILLENNFYQYQKSSINNKQMNEECVWRDIQIDGMNVVDIFLIFFSDQKFQWDFNQYTYQNFFNFYLQEIQEVQNLQMSELQPQPPKFLSNQQLNDSNSFSYENSYTSQREYNFSQKLSQNILNIKQCQCKYQQKYYWVDKNTILIEGNVNLSGFPTSTDFQQKNYYYIVNEDFNNQKKCRIYYGFKTVFNKNSLSIYALKDKIINNSEQENLKAWNNFKNQVVNISRDFVNKDKELNPNSLIIQYENIEIY